MPWPKPMPIVEVEWVDSIVRTGWRTTEDYNTSIDARDDVTNRTAGYLYRADKRVVCVVLSQGMTGNICDMMEIPRSTVRSLRIIEKPKGRK